MPDVNPIPEAYPRITPYLCVDGAADAIAFYTDVFGATERMRMGGEPGDPADKVGHAELEIGDGVIMLSDEFPDLGILSPPSIGGTPVTISLYVPDVDATVEAALARGATLVRPVATQFYGDRSGQVLDPWGHRWSIATHVEDVSADEMERRASASPGGGET
jgi:PhnB protein